jgi:hypothetical protein
VKRDSVFQVCRWHAIGGSHREVLEWCRKWRMGGERRWEGLNLCRSYIDEKWLKKWGKLIQIGVKKLTKSTQILRLSFTFTSENTIELILMSRTMVDVWLNILPSHENHLGIQDLQLSR